MFFFKNKWGKTMKDKGFTLIELIVVIAIIAVLAVVLAPQYIQYVERGRESNDLQIAVNIIDAAKVVIATNPEEIQDSEILYVVWETDKVAAGV